MFATVVVATFGNREEWEGLAQRALESAHRQTGDFEISRQHGVTLAEARNLGAQASHADYLVFLDADDELADGYLAAMRQVKGEIRRPSTLGVYDDGRTDDYPVLIPRRPLIDGNYIVIGAMVKRALFLAVGGFRDLPMSEDWDLFGRMVLEGATVADVPDAIYRVHIRDGSRNTDERLGTKVYRQIRDGFLEHPNVGSLRT